MCISMKGESIVPLLRNHIKSENIPKKFCSASEKNYTFWTEEEDLLLTEKFDIIGPKWKILEHFFVNRKSSEIYKIDITI